MLANFGYCLLMTQRLKERIETFIIKNGSAAKLDLAKAAGCSLRTLERWLNGETAPDGHERYSLALACGLTEAEAMTLAREDASKAKETA